MNKTEAIQALEAGKKVAQFNWPEWEFLTMKEGVVLDEDGYTEERAVGCIFMRYDSGWITVD